MHGEHADAERRGARDGPLDGLRDVVELEVEKDRTPGLGAERDGLGPRADEELEADLEHAHRVAHGERGRTRALNAGEIQREHDARIGEGGRGGRAL